MKKSVGVYIGHSEVIACSVSLRRGVPEIQKFAIESIKDRKEVEKKPSFSLRSKKLPPKSQESRAIFYALQKIGAKGAKVTVGFDPSNVVARYFEIPFIPENERAEAIRYEASRYVPFKMDEVVSDFKLKPKPGPEGSPKFLAVTYSAAKKDILFHYASDIKTADAKIDTIEPVFSSLSRALLTVERKLEDDYGFFFFDSNESVNITLIRGGLVYISHDFTITEDETANQNKVFQELKGSFEYVDRVSGRRWNGPIYLTGISDLNRWNEFLNTAHRNEKRFQILSCPAAKTIDAKSIGALSISYGLSLRQFKKKSPVGDFELMPSEPEERHLERLKYQILAEFGFFIIFFVLVRLLYLGPHLAEIKKSALNPPNLSGSKDAFANLSVAELTKTQERYKKSLKTLRDFSKEFNLMGQKLRILAKSKPPSMWFAGVQYGEEQTSKRFAVVVDQVQKSLAITGYCYVGNSEKEINVVNEWTKRLTNDPDFMAEMKNLKVREMRREAFLGREVTKFQVVLES